MYDCDMNMLSAFVDGELEPAVRESVATHLATCPRCQAEVNELRELSGAFANLGIEPLTRDENTRLHEQLDDSINAPIWRIGGAMGLIAASILVVAATWLAAIPTAKPTPGRATGPIVAVKSSDWSAIAITGFVPIQPVDDQVYLADSHLDEWMLDALNRSQP